MTCYTELVPRGFRPVESGSESAALSISDGDTDSEADSEALMQTGIPFVLCGIAAQKKKPCFLLSTSLPLQSRAVSKPGEGGLECVLQANMGPEDT